MIYYVPLERYPERYTEMLHTWTEAAFARARVPFRTVLPPGGMPLHRIATGPVLDAHARASFAARQMAELVRLMPDMDERDTIYLDDLFTPGFEAIPYVLAQVPPRFRPRIFARNYAQSVDPDDFTFPMRRWMRRYEEMVDACVHGVFVASTVHKEMIEAAGLEAPVHVVGLPFDSADVRSRCPTDPLPWADRPRRVLYASRLDREKQPHLMMDVAEMLRAHDPRVDFIVCTGAGAPRSNDPTALARLLDLQAEGVIRVEAGLTKAAYYTFLSTARVQLNTARQDFVSFTAIEASTFGTPTVAPAFRSFPEALENRRAQLYAPWCAEEAVDKVIDLLACDAPPPGVGRLATYSDGTFDRMLAVMADD